MRIKQTVIYKDKDPLVTDFPVYVWPEDDAIRLGFERGTIATVTIALVRGDVIQYEKLNDKE